MDPNERSIPKAFVLLIVGEPFSEEERTLIIDEITKGFKAWDVESTGININEELSQIAKNASFGTNGEGTNGSGRPGEQVIQQQSDTLAVEILINPLSQTVKNSLKKLLLAPGPTKYIIYAGHVFQGSGAWVLQDDTFSFGSLAQVFKNVEVANALKQNSDAHLTIHTLADSNWGPSISKADFTNGLKIQINPPYKIDSILGISQFVSYVGGFVRVVPITSLLQASEQFGNISFTRPTLYIFPGSQGDSALFGINGFNLLINGGYSRRACFWDFARHLDRVDAMVMTHLGTDNIFGLKTVLHRKCLENIHPQIGYLYFNAVEKRGLVSEVEESGDSKNNSSLLINLTEEANKMAQMAKQLGISPQPCTCSSAAATVEPVNLYHKLGHGSLDMYVLNPVADSKELKEFYQLCGKQVFNLGLSGSFPLQNVLSVCALFVWKPYNLDEKIVRILFPGNAPQHKIIEGFEKVKSLGFLKQATCTARSLTKPPPVKKPPAGSGKSDSGGKGPAKAQATSRTEKGKTVNVSKLESPSKEIKAVTTKPESKTLSPTKPVKTAFKEESSKKNSSITEKPKAFDKEAKCKSVSKGDQKVASAVVENNLNLRPAKEPSTAIKNTIPSEESSAKTSSRGQTDTALESRSLATGDNIQNNTSAFNHVDQQNLKEESHHVQLPDQNSVTVDNSISEAHKAIDDNLAVSFSSSVDRPNLEEFRASDNNQKVHSFDKRDTYQLEEEDEKPQALPEPAVMIESPCQESEVMPNSNSNIEPDKHDLSQHESTQDSFDKLKTQNDPAQEIPPSPEPSLEDQHYYQYQPPSELPSEFETPVFINDESDCVIPSQKPLEHNIQYGIDNSSTGRDMGGIQEVDEDEQDDCGSVTKHNNVQTILDRAALQEMGIYDDGDDDSYNGQDDGINDFDKDSTVYDDELKQDQDEEEEERGTDRFSAERQFEDVDDEASPQPEEDTAENVKRESEGDREDEDRDSTDGYTPDIEQDVDRDASALVNENVYQSEQEVSSFSGFKSANVVAVNSFIGLESSALPTQKQDFSGDSDDEPLKSFDPIKQWGQPMGLPSPPTADRRISMEGKKGASFNGPAPRPGTTANNKKRPLTAPGAATGKAASRQGSASNRPPPGSSRSSPLNAKTPTLPALTPFYVDLTYVPNHGDISYSDTEFFKRIRARYYVISALSPNPQVLDSLLEAKATWEQKDLDVTVIPTYENETLRHWMALNAEKLRELRVDLTPAVSRCTIQLQDLETSLPAYRLEV